MQASSAIANQPRAEAPNEAGMDPRTRVLLDGPIAATLLRLAVPNVLVMVAQASIGLIETYSKRLLEIKPEVPQALEGLAVSAFARGDFSTAETHYRRLTELMPEEVANMAAEIARAAIAKATP